MTTKPASPKQIALITRLLGEKEVPETSREWIEEALESETLTGGYGGTASRAIDHLFSLPRKQTGEEPPEAKPGFYVRGEHAYKVQQNKAGTHTYALEWSGTSWVYSPGTGRSLGGLVPMTGEQAAALGLASGRCIRCCTILGGETLSARVSALIGYGETCARHEGWYYPKGVVAQREYIASHVHEEVAV